MKVISSFGMKDPIKGVAFSNKEVSLTLEYEAPDSDWQEVKRKMDEQLQAMVAGYLSSLADEVFDGQDKALQALQIKVGEEYAEKLELAKAQIIKLEKELKANG